MGKTLTQEQQDILAQIKKFEEDKKKAITNLAELNNLKSSIDKIIEVLDKDIQVQTGKIDTKKIEITSTLKTTKPAATQADIDKEYAVNPELMGLTAELTQKTTERSTQQTELDTKIESITKTNAEIVGIQTKLDELNQQLQKNKELEILGEALSKDSVDSGLMFASRLEFNPEPISTIVIVGVQDPDGFYKNILDNNIYQKIIFCD